ncbi:hypothetical protein MSKU9_1933 [Komagataeibacter diospyri]|uniref:Uncharacterized protein n=2 Tax=Komagataeibacter diospyri TaxID=1932662 RepID=A0A4V0WMI5_9PROT|nr:hypothetical protein MSKU9_1933 [Komagataeibacter diospyri]
MFDNIIFLSGANYMSTDRKDWISDFLSLFQPVIKHAVGKEPAWSTLEMSADLPESYRKPGTLLIGHEISKKQALDLNAAGVSFMDIRISPLRFMVQDNIFAISTNRTEPRDILAEFAMPPFDIAVEARALALSLRYRDLGQHQFPAGSLVFFTEQPGGADSIHYGDEVSLHDYKHEIQYLSEHYPERYMICRPNDPPEDITLLENMGFRPASANFYAVLGSRNVAAVAAIRSGILSEAQYFGKKVHALEQPTTRLWKDSGDYNDGSSWFFNIAPDHALSSLFWKNVLAGKTCFPPDRAAIRRPQDLIRRALNNWNSSAIGLNLYNQMWHETVGNHIVGLRHLLQEENGFRLGQRPDADQRGCAALTGRWRWFSGEVVHIEADGHARSDSDFGRLAGSADEWTIHWVRRNLIDRLKLDETGGSLFVQNQYGDGGEAARLA